VGVADGTPGPVEPTDRVVRVVPDVPAIHRRFDYTVPAALEGRISVGSRVRVDLHGRRVAAWVVEDRVTPPDGVTPRAIAVSSGDGPPPSVVALAEWAAWRWAGPVSSFLGTASPLRVVRVGSPVDPGRNGDGNRSAGRSVESPGGGSVGLVAEALADPSRPSVVRLAPTLDATRVVLEVLHVLGPEGVLVLAPSLARAGALAERLRRAGAPVALLPDGWEAAATGTVAVVGARAAAWAPLARVRAVVVLDAHDEVYREERAPTWSAVEVVGERARRDRAPLVLVTPTPTVPLLEGARLVTPPRSVERRGWPAAEVVDRTGDDPRTGLFSEPLVRLLHSVLDRPEGRVVCILNRTGRGRLLACAHCGALARCTRCGGSVVQPVSGGDLRCSRCDLIRPPVCAECDSRRLKLLRMGVSRATEELAALVGVEAVEVSGPAVAGAGAVGAPAPGRERLVVGTEAALHRVGRADAVAFLDFDQHLLAPRFAAGEEALALLARAARLVGGREGGGRLLVQTRIPDHEVLRATVQGDPALVSDPERTLRLELGLPPFGALALLRGAGAGTYADGLRQLAGVSVSSPSDDRWLVRADDHRGLCDALAAVERPAGRLRVEVDPTDV
jgi:primosomal protein N' (replication factor Y)